MEHANRRRGSFTTLFLASLLTLAATPCAAEWRRLDSPNFVIVGDAGARTLRDIAVSFEGFRETLGRVLNERVTATAVPTIVIVFPSDKAFNPFKPKYQGKPIEIAGLFLSRPDVNYIALESTGGQEAMRIVFHEYAHLIVANAARNVPVWLNEGLAEYYSTYSTGAGGREAILGAPITSHLIQLNEATLLPLPQLLGVAHDSPLYNEGARRSLFYAQSWALTHMLLIGEPRRTQKLAELFSLVGQGIPAMDAWTRVFSGDPVEKDLKNYIRRRAFNAYQYKFTEKLAAFDATATRMPPGEADAFLADFLIQQGRHDEAAAQLAKGSGVEGTSAWAATVRAQLDVVANDHAAAEKRLLALQPNVDWLTGYRAGLAIADVAMQTGDKPAVGHIARVRSLFDSVRSAGRQLPNAVARLATLELATEDPPVTGTAEALERARTLAPGRLDYVFLHARVLAAQSAFGPARNIVGPLMSPAYPEDVRASARSLMNYIVLLEKARAHQVDSMTTASPAPPSTVAATQEGPVAGTDSDAIRAMPAGSMPLYRDLGPGEQRLEGTLDRIDCQSDRAVFHVRTADGSARLMTAPRMDGVEFITYRNDLRGNVGCGTLATPAHVYVTSRTADGAATTVAIEFLPK